MLTPTIERTTISSQSKNAWHLRAVRLPDGDRPEDWWAADGQWIDHPIEGAHDLPGRFVLPGLVDAHAHLTLDFNNSGLRGKALVDFNAKEQSKSGVLAIRDMGTAPGARLDPSQIDGVHLIKPSPLFAPAGRYFQGLAKIVAEHELVGAALDAVANGAAWVKVIADFAGPDGNWWKAPANYSAETLRQLVEAVHAKGAKVAVHTTGPFASECVRAGVDSIEHGPSLTADDLAEMARRGTAWCPTLAVSSHYSGMAMRAGGPIAEAARKSLADIRQLLPLAARLGVIVLTGTDELPHGSLATEVVTLHQYGLPVTAALGAASVNARAYLGLPNIENGAPADFVTFDADPRHSLETLARPAAVVSGGNRVR
jgi:imidazolonepropionase-like amidohydrolase